MRMPISERRRLRGERIDWLLSVLAGVLSLLIFVFAPLQAMGISAFHLFADGLLLAIIISMVIISNSPAALVLMSLALVSNVAVFFLRIYYPVPYHLHILAGAWLVIACTLGGASVSTKSMQHRKRDRPILSGDPFGEARYPRTKQHGLSAQADL